MNIKHETRVERLAGAPKLASERSDLRSEQSRAFSSIDVHQSLYVATGAADVSCPPAHSVPVGEIEGDRMTQVLRAKTSEGTVHTPAASRLPDKKARKSPPDGQMSLPLPAPHPMQRGHDQATREREGRR